jgi:hypothetical protein
MGQTPGQPNRGHQSRPDRVPPGTAVQVLVEGRALAARPSWWLDLSGGQSNVRLMP